jgi:hypothetical protein
MMEAIRSSETSVLTRPTRRHISEDGISNRIKFVICGIFIFNLVKSLRPASSTRVWVSRKKWKPLVSGGLSVFSSLTEILLTNYPPKSPVFQSRMSVWETLIDRFQRKFVRKWCHLEPLKHPTFKFLFLKNTNKVYSLKRKAGTRLASFHI